jgi:CRP-like cAMP-binding protein
LLAHVVGKARLEALLAAYGLKEVVPSGDCFQDTDRALELAEDALLADVVASAETSCSHVQEFVETSLFNGLDTTEREQLQSYFETCELAEEGTLFRMGDAGDRLFVLVSGEVTLGLRIEGRRELRRLSTITPGVVFGEMALLDALPRSAEAVCVRMSTLKSLSQASFERMRDDAPLLFAKLLQNVAREMSQRLRITNRQLGALES